MRPVIVSVTTWSPAPVLIQKYHNVHHDSHEDNTPTSLCKAFSYHSWCVLIHSVSHWRSASLLLEMSAAWALGPWNGVCVCVCTLRYYITQFNFLKGEALSVQQHRREEIKSSEGGFVLLWGQSAGYWRSYRTHNMKYCSLVFRVSVDVYVYSVLQMFAPRSTPLKSLSINKWWYWVSECTLECEKNERK